MSAYLLVSIQASYFQLETVKADQKTHQGNVTENKPREFLLLHPWWEKGTNWKSALNNLRLIIQPYIFYSLLLPWLEILKIPRMKRGFLELIDIMNEFLGFSNIRVFRELQQKLSAY